MTEQKNKRYNAEFKIMIVKLYLSGRSAISLSAEFGMSRIAVHRWKKQYIEDPANAFSGKRKKKRSDPTRELESASQKIYTLEEEVKILKIALSYYTKTENKKGA